MKNRRSLSGIYFIFKNPETGNWENRCFEDLPTKKQEEIIDAKSKEWTKSLAIQLADTLNRIGNQFHITPEEY